MLQNLAIRNIVSIERADIGFGAGLNVLSGETGAGKSILLDSLGLALGWRAESGLARPDTSGSSVTASFHFNEHSNLHRLAAQHDIEIKGELILRRQISADGRSRAFVNDQAVSISFLRAVGELFVEIEGQFASQGLLESNNHRAFLDDFAEHAPLLKKVKEAHEQFKECQKNYDDAKAIFEQAVAEKDFLKASLSELEALAPIEGEETTLANQRKQSMEREKIEENLVAASALMDGDGKQGVTPALSLLRKHVEELALKSPEQFASTAKTVESLIIELNDVSAHISSVRSSMESGDLSLSVIEERFFAIKAVARKHDVSGDELPEFIIQLQDQLASLHAGQDNLSELDKQRGDAFSSLEKQILALRESRILIGKKLDAAVMKELTPLKLEKGQFVTDLIPLEKKEWNDMGGDKITFHVSFSRGLALGPIGKIASGGELSRLMLALRVAGASVRSPPSLVFDEVDSGIGGAVASAVGARLRLLSQHRQVIVVTHSPQVTAQAHHHFRVRKKEEAEIATTNIENLNKEERMEEVARMLAGENVTDEARQAAQNLFNQTHVPSL